MHVTIGSDGKANCQPGPGLQHGINPGSWTPNDIDNAIDLLIEARIDQQRAAALESEAKELAATACRIERQVTADLAAIGRKPSPRTQAVPIVTVRGKYRSCSVVWAEAAGVVIVPAAPAS